jgi:hypothetical protein
MEEQINPLSPRTWSFSACSAQLEMQEFKDTACPHTRTPTQHTTSYIPSCPKLYEWATVAVLWAQPIIHIFHTLKLLLVINKPSLLSAKIDYFV